MCKENLYSSSSLQLLQELKKSPKAFINPNQYIFLVAKNFQITISFFIKTCPQLNSRYDTNQKLLQYTNSQNPTHTNIISTWYIANYIIKERHKNLA